MVMQNTVSVGACLAPKREKDQN